MSIIENIKKANFEAMKNKDVIALKALPVVLAQYKNAEIDARFKDKTLSDLDTIQILQKQIKETRETLENFIIVNNTAKIEETKAIESILLEYLPQMLSELEIKNIIISLATNNIGDIMKHFKVNYAGKVDMSLVTKVAKSL